MSIEDQVIAKIQSRKETGFKKYGVSMERDDLSFWQWVQHLQEELLDAAIYAEKMMQIAIDKKKVRNNETHVYDYVWDKFSIKKWDGELQIVDELCKMYTPETVQAVFEWFFAQDETHYLRSKYINAKGMLKGTPTTFARLLEEYKSHILTEKEERYLVQLCKYTGVGRDENTEAVVRILAAYLQEYDCSLGDLINTLKAKLSNNPTSKQMLSRAVKLWQK